MHPSEVVASYRNYEHVPNEQVAHKTQGPPVEVQGGLDPKQYAESDFVYLINKLRSTYFVRKIYRLTPWFFVTVLTVNNPWRISSTNGSSW